LGYPDELGGIQKTEPELLGRNGTYVVFRKLHQRVADFRRYLNANSKDPQEEELLAAKMMGRWRSGAPLALCPFHDDPNLAQILDAITTFFSKQTIRQDSKHPVAHIYVELIHAMQQ
jgi:Predicted iron-dependent peroxidase